jgi:hypothetical protein
MNVDIYVDRYLDMYVDILTVINFCCELEMR